ncbi:MAG: hypothetical protein ACOX0I_02025 [Bacilli bacterium]|jgi:hypothetical protein
MDWFNYYGLVILIILMIPNIIYSIKVKDGFKNKFGNKILEYSEQIGRYGSFIFLVFNIPKLFLGFWFSNALVVYLIVNGILLIIYLTTWVVMWGKNNLVRALFLSICPSLIFIFSGIMTLNFPLMIFSVLFAVTHITISVKNAI